jgi:hypothetical protein
MHQMQCSSEIELLFFVLGCGQRIEITGEREQTMECAVRLLSAITNHRDNYDSSRGTMMAGRVGTALKESCLLICDSVVTSVDAGLVRLDSKWAGGGSR